MRRRLILVFMAVSTMVVTAFIVPLGFLVRHTAEDRAIGAARSEVSAVVPVLAAGATREQVQSAVGATRAGAEGRLAVLTPTDWFIGEPFALSAAVQSARTEASSSLAETEGGVEMVAAVITGAEMAAVVRVFVPDEELYRGQWRAWLALLGVGVALVAISVVVADRLAASVVRPTQALAGAARRLGEGDLGASVEPEGPDELVELGTAFNDLGYQVSSMLARERELVAELSHRLRTPLTKLKMRVDQVGDVALAGQLRDDVDGVTREVNAIISEARGLLDRDRRCDATAVVRERALYWQVLAEDLERPWKLVEPGSSAFVALTESELSAALNVLLENVFSHTPDGAAVEVGAVVDGARVRIYVADGGSGFDSSSIERGVSGGGSTGLGLDIARKLAVGAGGDFAVSPSSLGGSEVSLDLPLRS